MADMVKEFPSERELLKYLLKIEWSKHEGMIWDYVVDKCGECSYLVTIQPPAMVDFVTMELTLANKNN